LIGNDLQPPKAAARSLDASASSDTWIVADQW
jgi:hypothetical protein